MLQRFGEIAPEREVKFAPCDLKSVEADGTFSGYASLFGAVDLGQDLVMPGAFAESLDARGTRGSCSAPRRKRCRRLLQGCCCRIAGCDYDRVPAERFAPPRDARRARP
jgi:hypothetical protein